MKWTSADLQLLRKKWTEGMPILEIADQLERDPDAVVHRLIEYGIIGFNDDNCFPRPSNFGQPWEMNELCRLREEYNQGLTITKIAKKHQRNKNSIFHYLVTYKIIDFTDRMLLEKLSNQIDEGQPLPHTPDNHLIIEKSQVMQDSHNMIIQRDAIQITLQEILTSYNLSIIEDPKRIKALLKDHCKGEHSLEINVIIIALEEGIPQEILRSNSGIPKTILKTKLKTILLENTYLSEDLVIWAIDSWMMALKY